LPIAVRQAPAKTTLFAISLSPLKNSSAQGAVNFLTNSILPQIRTKINSFKEVFRNFMIGAKM
jgi:hypothetical protein